MADISNGNAVYWIGQDGNIWLKSAATGWEARNSGAASQTSILNQVDSFATRIPDPNPGGGGRVQGASTGSSGGSSGSSGPPPLNEAAIANTQKAIDSLGTELNTGYGNIDDDYSGIIRKYDRERTRNKGDYDENTVTNTTNLSKNKQNALLSASQGLRGLRSVLASIGALGGTGRDLANRAVTTSANEDIGGAVDNYAGNASMLDKAWKRFDEEDDERRSEANTNRENSRTALEGRIASKKQNFFQKMAELFAQAEQNDQAKTWLDRAGDLNDVIARKTRVAASPFVAKAAAYTPSKLESYLAGAGDMTVGVSGAGSTGLGSLSTVLAGRGRRRREEETA